MRRARRLLSADEHDRFARDGYLKLEGLLPPSVVKDALLRLHADGPDVALGALIPDAVHDVVGQLVHPVDHRCGWGPVYKPRPYEPERDWGVHAHIDNHYPTIMPVRTLVSAMVFMTRVRPRGGGLCVVPGSHRANRELMRIGYGEFFSRCWGRPDGLVEVLTEPGDVVVFHYLLTHSTSPNVDDPQTRHAFVMRFHAASPWSAERAISIGGSTVARAFEPDGRRTPIAAPNEPDDGPIEGHVVLRAGGRVHRIWARSDRPGTLRVRSSTDFDDWSRRDIRVPLPLDASIRQLGLTQCPSGNILTVTTETETSVLRAGAGLDWQLESTLRITADAAAPFWASRFASRSLDRCVLFLVAGDRLQAITASSWAELSTFEPRDLGPIAPLHHARDLVVAPIASDAEFAIIVDGDTVAGEHSTLISRRKDVGAEAPFGPLAYTSEAAPLQIRVYDRSDGFWLMSYLREHDGHRVPRWGTVDWGDHPPAVREISGGTDLRDALRRVGLA